MKGFDLEGSGFASRAELRAWLEFIGWENDPSSDPDAYSYVGGVGWVPTADVELKRQRARTLAPQPSSAPRLLTLREAGALVRVAPETIRYWCWLGKLTAHKPGGRVLIREDELLALANHREARSNRRPPTRQTRRVLPRKP